MAQREMVKAESIPAEVRDVPHRIREGGLILAMVALVAVSAQLAVPIPGTPVPITLQDLAAFAVGLLVGPARGGVALAAYVLLGATGAPVFSNGHGGLPWLMGPTGGFLLAFPISAWLCGLAVRTGSVWTLALGIIAAQAVMFACGIGQLMLVTGTGISAGIQQALIPFLPGVAFKSALLLVLGIPLLSRRRSV